MGSVIQITMDHYNGSTHIHIHIHIFETGFNNIVNLNVSGGSEFMTYFASARYQYSDGNKSNNHESNLRWFIPFNAKHSN